jgi:hypothetical protein
VDHMLRKGFTTRTLVLSTLLVLNACGGEGRITPGLEVEAGADLNLPAAAITTLRGEVVGASGDLSVAWSQLSGPGEARFADPAALRTSVSFTAAGTYVLQLTASAGEATRRDQLSATVGPAATITVSWERAADAPLGRTEALGGVLGGKLYVFGGYTSFDVIPKSFEAHVYDPQTDLWTRLPDLPRPLTHTGTASDGQSFYFAGGVVGSSTPGVLEKIDATREVWRFDTVSQSWSAMPPLPEPRGAGTLELLGNTLHFFGGTGLDRYTSVGDHWTLDLGGSGVWEPAAPLPIPRNHLASAVVNGKIYAIGGQEGHNETLVTQTAVHVWDPAEPDGWREAADLPYGLSHIGHAALVLEDGRILVAGGETGAREGARDVSSVIVYDPDSDSWSYTTPLPFERHSFVGGVVGGEVILGGGSRLNTRTYRGILSD